MILQRTLRPQASLRAVASSLVGIPSSMVSCAPRETAAHAITSSQNGALPRFQLRGIHHVPQLTHDATFRKEGVPDLLSAEGFDLAWTQYQGRMVEKLNNLTAGMRMAFGKGGKRGLGA
jgi:hypothetical protein